MLDFVAFRYDFSGLRLALDGAGDRLLGGAIVEILDFLVVCRFPMNEHADANKEIVGLGLRDDAFGDAIGDRLRDRMLSRSKHLYGLLGALDRHLVEEQRVRLRRQIGRDDREERREAVLVVRKRVAEGGASRAGFGTDDLIDVRHFIAVANQGLAQEKVGHVEQLPSYGKSG